MRRLVFILCFCMAGCAMRSSFPQESVPPEIAHARAVFVVNGGGSNPGKVDHELTRAYDEFLDAMQSWNHFAVVSRASDADLVMEIVYEWELEPRIELTISSARTHAVLARSTEYISFGPICFLTMSCMNKAYDQAVEREVADVKGLV